MTCTRAALAAAASSTGGAKIAPQTPALPGMTCTWGVTSVGAGHPASHPRMARTAIRPPLSLSSPGVLGVPRVLAVIWRPDSRPALREKPGQGLRLEDERGNFDALVLRVKPRSSRTQTVDGRDAQRARRAGVASAADHWCF